MKGQDLTNEEWVDVDLNDDLLMDVGDLESQSSLQYLDVAAAQDTDHSLLLEYTTKLLQRSQKEQRVLQLQHEVSHGDFLRARRETLRGNWQLNAKDERGMTDSEHTEKAKEDARSEGSFNSMVADSVSSVDWDREKEKAEGATILQASSPPSSSSSSFLILLSV